MGNNGDWRVETGNWYRVGTEKGMGTGNWK